jgi:hypothetical protein
VSTKIISQVTSAKFPISGCIIAKHLKMQIL